MTTVTNSAGVASLGKDLSSHTMSTETVSCDDATCTTNNNDDEEEVCLSRVSFRSSKLTIKHDKKQKLQNHYELLDFLGSGGFGSVFKCRHLKTGQERAVKIVKKDKTNKKQKHQIHQEFKIHSQLDHPNILQALELFEDKHHFCIVTELCRGGDLHEYVYTHGPLTEQQVAIVVQRLLSAVQYCHEHNLVHRDLKPENLLLQNPNDFTSLKLIDFGLARLEKPGKAFHTIVGSPFYVSPQVVAGNYHRPCDMWAVGTIAYTLLAGKPPFEAETDAEVLERISIGWVQFDDPAFDHITVECSDFLRQMMAFEELQRPTAPQALQHDWFHVNNTLAATAASQIPPEEIRHALQALQSFRSQDCKLKQATATLLSCHYRQPDPRRDAIFRALDANSHGRLTLQDLQKAFADYMQLDYSPQQLLQQLLPHISFSGSPHLNYSEFIAILSLQTNGSQVLPALYQYLDRDQKGYLTLEDLQGGFQVDASIAAALLAQVTEEHVLSRQAFEQAILGALSNRPNDTNFTTTTSSSSSSTPTLPILKKDPCLNDPLSSESNTGTTRADCNSNSRGKASPLRRTQSLVAGAA